MNALLTAEAYFELTYTDLVRLRGFRALRRLGRGTPTRRATPCRDALIPAVVTAVSTAGTLYVKPVFCLQRSLAVIRLLRRRGVPAELVIGCTMLPMASHAWVEVDGTIVSEERDAQALTFYSILDRW